MSFGSPALGKHKAGWSLMGLRSLCLEPRRETQTRVLVDSNQVMSLTPGKEQYQQVRGPGWPELELAEP